MRRTLQTITNTIRIQVIDITGSGLWIIKAQNLRVVVYNNKKILPCS